ncbi:nSTAND1 domain-containing NTPase [Streptomyces sp. NPDC005131]
MQSGTPQTGHSTMATLALADPVVLVLAEGETQSAINNARGHLFERFVAHLLHSYGYDTPSRERLNVSADGIELDISATHRLTGQPAIAECKAYSSPVKASMLGTFHSKLVVSRYENSHTHGFFVSLPRLTAQGQEQAELIGKNDKAFTVLTATGVVSSLHELHEIEPCPIDNVLVSDPAILVTDHGIYSACLELDTVTRTPSRLLVWGKSGPVPTPVLDMLKSHSYSQGAAPVDVKSASPVTGPPSNEATQIIVTVEGSKSDFEYQLPAAPKYFVGRQRLVGSLEASLGSASVIVLNAQSGWGKSSLALKLEALALQKGGHALIVDSRTAASRRFVTDVLSRAAMEAEGKGLLALPEVTSWASLASSLRTLKSASWSASSPLVVFFDQFENVFRDEALTREFRDLALGSRDLSGKLLVGFAWKTDHVGWTESYPYQLRDEIRAGASTLSVGPMGASDIDTLLRRLEKQLGSTLARDLRQRLREYSQGLPWLFKKLAGHLLREVEQGATQEQLASEALNVQNLFDSDLAELGLKEQEALRHIARYAPIAIGEVEERVAKPVLETLVHRRLVVQVGERIDTYWDIFRDYLNTGNVPVEDSYVLRQTPRSVARLLREVVKDEGNGSVPQIAHRLSTSENALFNLSRELRLLGVTAYEANRVRILGDIWNAEDRERAFRKRVSDSLRRHRAYTVFTALAERLPSVPSQAYARELPSAFPAVEVAQATWTSYARAFLLWFEYAGLAAQNGQAWSPTPENSEGVGQLLGGWLARRINGTFVHRPPGPALALLVRLKNAQGNRLSGPFPRGARHAVRALTYLQLATEGADGALRLMRPDVLIDEKWNQPILQSAMSASTTGAELIRIIQQRPHAGSEEVGATLKDALNADWSDNTTEAVGKHARAWARAAGLHPTSEPSKIKQDILEFGQKLEG